MLTPAEIPHQPHVIPRAVAEISNQRTYIDGANTTTPVHEADPHKRGIDEADVDGPVASTTYVGVAAKQASSNKSETDDLPERVDQAEK